MNISVNADSNSTLFVSLGEEAQKAYDVGLGTTLALNCLIAFILLTLFEILRRFFKGVYQPRLDGSDNSPPPIGAYPFAWIKSTLLYPEEKFYHTHGLDSLMYLKFLETAILIVAIQCIYGMVILFPVNATAENKDLPKEDPLHTSGTALISMSNIPIGSYRLIAHAGSVLFNSAVTGFLMVRGYWTYLTYRRRYLKYHKPQSYTVMVHLILPFIQTIGARNPSKKKRCKCGSKAL